MSGGGVVGTNEVYDPATDSWTSLAPMPTPREHLAAAVIGDRVFVAGGRAPANFATLEAYSPATNTWQRLTDMPTARGGLGAAASGGKLYVFGGEAPGVFPHNEEYDPLAIPGGAWPTCRRRDTASARRLSGRRSTSIGGGTQAGFGAAPTNERYTPPQ